MSRSKDYFIGLANLERAYLDFVARLLEAQGYVVLSRREHPGPGFERSVPDLLVKDPAGKRAAVELKLYRTSSVGRDVVQSAIRGLLQHISAANISRAILIVTVPVPNLPPEPTAEIWGLEKLWELAKDDDVLTQTLADLVRETEIDTLGGRRQSDTVAWIIESARSQTPPGAGAALARELEACPEGKAAARKFEALCERALKFLFGEEFAGWTPQRPVDGGFQWIDLIARLAPRHEFWLALAQDFRARYIVFEFKNYREPLTQAEIYTTEKYLFTSALRPVATIIARNGDSDSARRAARGALREAGKLILCVSLDELIHMLHDRDAGKDPNNLLIQKLDTMLMEIAR